MEKIEECFYRLRVKEKELSPSDIYKICERLFYDDIPGSNITKIK